jgi:hypothetical protein
MRLDGHTIWPYASRKLFAGWIGSIVSRRCFKGRGKCNRRFKHEPSAEIVWLDCGGADPVEWLSVVHDWRYLFQLCWMLTAEGYRIRMPLQPAAVDDEDLRDLLNLPGVECGCTTRVDRDTALLAGAVADASDDIGAVRLVFDPSTVIDNPAECRMLQYPPHRRTVLSSAWTARARLARENHRRARILYAGSCDHHYAEQVCGLPGRRLSVERVRTGLFPLEQNPVTSGSRFRRRFVYPGGPIDQVFVELGFNRQPWEWLYVLGLADFFLCLPGREMPMCHNAVEAMAVGSIPILSYPDWFHPPLEDGKNCIVFCSDDELVPAIRRALAMSEREIRVLRESATKYYETWLTESASARRLLSGPGKTVVINAECNIDRITAASAVCRQEGGLVYE